MGTDKYDIVYGYEDKSGEFVEEGQVEEGLEDSYPQAYDDDGLIEDKESAESIAAEMDKAAEEFHTEDLAEGLADPNGPVVHKAVPADEVEL